MTTQLNKQDADSTLSCSFSTNDSMLQYKRLDSLFYTDTFYSKKVVIKRGFSIMRIFVSDKGFVKLYRMKYETGFLKALKLFCKEVRIPKEIILDPHPSQKSNQVQTFLNKVGTTLQVLYESSQHSDRTELYIGLM